ncbi:Hypothetical predicted protein [Pelobates cultripes]|uniref:Speedy protein C n=1 Tax=Pelobates cultripes TaxID=61616 RepID=A0AAD1T7X4_PELCU|nr:Hypothetical predicted protein [Pelobates cultripes]
MDRLVFSHNRSSPASKRRTKDADIVPGQEDDRHLDIKGKEQREAFYQLLDDAIVQAFLYTDEYFKSSDKYLLAMVMTYFQRAGLKKEECNRDNFFTALYLANCIEEEEPFYNQIYPWALGGNWRLHLHHFCKARDQLWLRMGFQALVSRETCEQIMAANASHWAWTRTRINHHGGAIRHFRRKLNEFVVRVPLPWHLLSCPCQRNANYTTSNSRVTKPAQWEVAKIVIKQTEIEEQQGGNYLTSGRFSNISVHHQQLHMYPAPV